MPLDDLDRRVLELEGQVWHRPGAKETAIREQFDWTPTRFYQHLDEEEALAEFPLLVNRLRRLRDR